MNKKEDDKWLKVLRERMEDYSEPLPEGLWEELEGDLNRPKVIPLWRRWPAVAAAVALVLLVNSLLLSYWFAPLFDEGEMRQAQQLEPESVNLTGGSASVKGEADWVMEVPTEDVEFITAVASGVKSVDVKSAGLAATSDVVDVPTVDASDEVAPVSLASLETTDEWVDEVGDSEQIAQTTPQEEEEAVYPQYRTNTRTRAASAYQLSYRKKRQRGDVQLGIHTGGSPYKVSKGFSGMSRLLSAAHEMKAPVLMGDMTSGLSPYNQVLFRNRDQETYTKVNHHMPINVVASVKWQFAENWAFETGISYTYLESDLHSGANFFWEDNQKLHYVGIPLKIHRSIWGNSTFGVYASAGGMIEKCVSGTLKSTYVANGNERKEESSSIDSHPFQASLMAAIGAQVNFVKSLSLFVEPGMAYYFDDNSCLATIRKEHPFNFNLQFGLRFNLAN